MRHALLQRFGHGLLVLWAAFTLSFVLLQVLPGDAVLIKFQNPDLGLSPAQIEEMRVACVVSGQARRTISRVVPLCSGTTLEAGREAVAGLAISENSCL